MPMKRCKDGLHLYDPAKHAACPYCEGDDADSVQQTRPKSGTSQPTAGSAPGATEATQRVGGDDVGKTTPIGRPPDSEPAPPESSKQPGMTIGIQQKELGFDPVVGWLVCVNGAEQGRDYRIRSGRNFIGRDSKMDISIQGDDTISRERHAIISYDPRTSNFRLSPGESHGLVYHNSEMVDMPTSLGPYDLVEVGKTTLLFVPFCGEQFKWDQQE